jgi:hypothetical protein
MSYNTANLILVDQEIYHSPKMYTIDTLENRDTPTENLPEGWTVTEQGVFDYVLMVTKAYSICNAEFVVANENGVPQYLTGEFEE